MKVILLSRITGDGIIDGALRYTLLLHKLLTRENIDKELFLFTGKYELLSLTKQIILLVKVFLKIIKELRKDVVIVHALIPSIYCILIPFFRNKFIVTIHDLEPVFYRKNLVERLLFKILWKISTFSRLIIVVSTQTQEELMKYFKLRSEKIKILHPPIKRFRQDVAKCRVDDKFRIGYFSPTHVRKGLHLAFRVLKKFKKKYPNIDCEFHICGRITEIDPYSLAEKHALRDFVKVHGSLPESELSKALKSIDVLLFPSLYEGFGLPIIEASSLGVPVLLFKWARIPSEAREVGIQCTSIDDMVEKLWLIASNRDVRAEFIKKAVEKARRFIERNTWRELLKIYIESIKSRSN